MSQLSSTPIVVDGKGHLLGRLASIVAKQLLTGQVCSTTRSKIRTPTDDLWCFHFTTFAEGRSCPMRAPQRFGILLQEQG